MITPVPPEPVLPEPVLPEPLPMLPPLPEPVLPEPLPVLPEPELTPEGASPLAEHPNVPRREEVSRQVAKVGEERKRKNTCGLL
jgi:hypothetical protein